MPNALDRRAALRRAIARDQAQWRHAVHELRSVVKERTDIASRIRQDPYPYLVGGFVLGMVLGLRSRA